MSTQAQHSLHIFRRISATVANNTLKIVFRVSAFPSQTKLEVPHIRPVTNWLHRHHAGVYQKVPAAGALHSLPAKQPAWLTPAPIALGGKNHPRASCEQQKRMSISKYGQDSVPPKMRVRTRLTHSLATCGHETNSDLCSGHDLHRGTPPAAPTTGAHSALLAGHWGAGSRPTRGCAPSPPHLAGPRRPLAARADQAEQHGPALGLPPRGDRCEGSQESSRSGDAAAKQRPLLRGRLAFPEMRGQPCTSSGGNTSSARRPGPLQP